MNDSSRATTILVVEDDSGVHTLLNVLLGREGYVVHRLGDGEGAVERILEGNYDVILLDLLLPRLSGFEVLSRLREEAPELLGRVIIFTAVSEQELSRLPTA